MKIIHYSDLGGLRAYPVEALHFPYTIQDRMPRLCLWPSSPWFLCSSPTVRLRIIFFPCLSLPGCHNQTAQTGCLIQKCISSQFLRCARSRYQHGLFLLRALFWTCRQTPSHCVLSWGANSLVFLLIWTLLHWEGPHPQDFI